MIKIIEGLKVKPGVKVQDIFLKFRSNAMQYPGFIGAENLASQIDPSVHLFVSTWNANENWKAWKISAIRTELYRQAKELIVDEPRVSVFTILPTHW
jgi:heme-degrading monooxygenase HmoA